MASIMSAPMTYQVVVFQSRFRGGGGFFFFLLGGIINSPSGYFEHCAQKHCSTVMPAKKRRASRKKCVTVSVITKMERER